MVIRAFAGAAVLWVVALLVSTFAASGRLGGAWGYPIAVPAYAMGAVVCHQRAERSFHMRGVPMPVCARCTGIYAGAALAAAGALAVQRRRVTTTSKGACAGLWAGAARVIDDGYTERIPMRALVIGVLPSTATLVYEWSTGEAPGNWARALAGMPLGAVLAQIVAATASPSLGGQ